jgi:predicted ArsR family transcriptional regulator
MHPNGVRVHLQRMSDAGLLVRRRGAQQRGRPRDEWAISATAQPGVDPPRAYGALARWLARAIPATPRRLAEVEATGRVIGRELMAAAAPRSARQAIGDQLTALGFQPQVESEPSDRFVCRLRNCPYRDSVRENQPVICGLHRGLMRGMLDQVAAEATLERFVPHDPDQAGCEIDIGGLALSAER